MRDAAHQAVAEVLRDLQRQRLGQLLVGDLGVQRVEQLGHRAARELDVDHRAGHAHHATVGVLARCLVGLSAVAVILFFASYGLTAGVGERVCATDDFADFLGDLGLPLAVGLKGQGLDEVVGVVGGRLHRPLARRQTPTPPTRAARRRRGSPGSAAAAHRNSVVASGSNEYSVRGPVSSSTYSTTIGAIRCATARLRHHRLELGETMCSSSTPRMPSGPGSSPTSSAPARKASTSVDAIS